MVFKVAKELQPAVIYIDDAEKVWVSARGKHMPPLARMRKSLMLQRAALDPADRVLIVGNSRQPFHEKTDMAELRAFFGYQHGGKMLYCPCPSHHTRLQLWRLFIERAGVTVAQLAQSHKFDLSSLAFVSEGYSAGSILLAVQATLPARRAAKVLATGRSIDVAEFLECVLVTCSLPGS